MRPTVDRDDQIEITPEHRERLTLMMRAIVAFSNDERADAAKRERQEMQFRAEARDRGMDPTTIPAPKRVHESPMLTSALLTTRMSAEERSRFESLSSDEHKYPADSELPDSYYTSFRHTPMGDDRLLLTEARLSIADRAAAKSRSMIDPSKRGMQVTPTEARLRPFMTERDIRKLHFINRALDGKPDYALDNNSTKLKVGDHVRLADNRRVRIVALHTHDSSEDAQVAASDKRVPRGLTDMCTVTDDETGESTTVRASEVRLDIVGDTRAWVKQMIGKE